MSRGNIVATIPDPSGGTIIFSCRDGSTRAYHYGLKEFMAIGAGADPKDEPQGADLDEAILAAAEALGTL